MASQEVAALGWFGHSNCGDEAFKLALQKLFPTYIFKFINNLSINIELINRCQYLLIGGGNIVSKDFLKGLELITIPYSFIGVGLVKDSATEFLMGAEHVLIRDLNSIKIASTCTNSALLIPDITFCLQPHKENGKLLLNKIKTITPNRPTLGVFLNDCVSARFDSTILKFIEAEKAKLELSRFLEGLSCNVVFIPMSYVPPDDRRISLDVIGKMQRGFKYSCITEELSPQDCLDLTSSLDYAITMRLHASIFCTLSGVPFIDLTHHDKSKGYLSSIGHGEYSLDYYEFNVKSLGLKYRHMLKNTNDITERLLEVTKSNRVLLREIIHNVHLLPGQ